MAIATAIALAIPNLSTAQHTAALGDLMTAFVQPRHIKLGRSVSTGTNRTGHMPHMRSISCAKRSPMSTKSCRKYRDLSIPDMITGAGYSWNCYGQLG